MMMRPIDTTGPVAGDTPPVTAAAAHVSGRSGPLISVVIPTYNRASLLPRAIASVLRQTYRRLEIIVVDDGSAQDVASVVRAIADPRVRYVRHEINKGLPAGRNTGIREARGEYVAFLDDDDEWRQDKLEKQLRAIRGHGAVACNAVVNGFVIREHRRPDITLEDLRRGTFAPSGLMVRADVLRRVWFDENLRQGEDWDGFIRIAQRCAIAHVPEPLLIYHEGDHARMTNEAKHLSGADLEKRTAVLHKHRQFLGEHWFRYHQADTFLGFLGARRDRWGCLQYAVQRCGIAPVASVLLERSRRRLRRLWATGR